MWTRCSTRGDFWRWNNGKHKHGFHSSVFLFAMRNGIEILVLHKQTETLMTSISTRNNGNNSHIHIAVELTQCVRRNQEVVWKVTWGGFILFPDKLYGTFIGNSSCPVWKRLPNNCVLLLSPPADWLLYMVQRYGSRRFQIVLPLFQPHAEHFQSYQDFPCWQWRPDIKGKQ